MIGLFYWKYREDGGDICHFTSWGKFCLSLTGKEIVHKILLNQFSCSRFPCIPHGVCFWQCLQRNFDLGTREAFSRFWKSHQTSKESFACNHKSQGYVLHSANQTWKANYNSVASYVCKYLCTFQAIHTLNMPEFCCLSSESSGGLLFLVFTWRNHTPKLILPFLLRF